MMLTREDIVAALDTVRSGPRGKSVTEAGMISGVALKSGGEAAFVISVTPEDLSAGQALRAECERAVAAVPGVTIVRAVLTAHAAPGAQAPRARANWNTEPLAHVRRILAVASGKGGVGKSTTAVNLAHAFVADGRRTGLLDADVTGPSIPRMMALKGAPELKENRIVPPVSYGIKCLSMGLLVQEDAALVWRGPQLSKALNQMLRGAEWGTTDSPLDLLLIDMPPGTGDIHLSLAQQVPLSGVVIVTTPQEVAVADARKCIDMFRKVQVPILGVIENMSQFIDPVTGASHAVFGAGGGRRLAAEQHVAFLGEIPLVMALGEASDAGRKFEDQDGLYRAITRQL